MEINPKLDLVLERKTEIPPELIWRAWTEPKLLMQWFCPKPWSVADVKMELRPGGAFNTVMQSPEGEKFPNAGCFLEVTPGKKLVFTSALQAGFRPAPASKTEHDFPFTAVITIEPDGKGSKYTAVAIHRDEAGCKQHEQMGFHSGWGAAFDQLVELVKKL